MPINYGSIDHRRPRKPREKSLINHGAIEEGDHDINQERLEKRLLQLATQNRAPSVAKAATAELLERVAPKKRSHEPSISASDAVKIATSTSESSILHPVQSAGM